MRLDDLSLRTKGLIPLLVMAATVVAIVAFGALRLSDVSAAANDIIQKRDRAATQMTRASRRMTLLPLALLGAIDYEIDSPEGRAATSDVQAAPAAAIKLLDEAAGLLPDKADEIGLFRTRFATQVEKAKAPLDQRGAAQGLAHGAELKPEDLAQLAPAAAMTAAIDLKIRDLAKDITAFNEALLVANAAAAVALKDDARQAVLALTLGGLAATLAAGAISLWLTRAKIANPIVTMVAAMSALAQGDLKVEIDARGRRDEIGAMAKALQAFRASAVEKAQAERDAVRLRAEADAERDRAAEQRARIAAEQSAAIEALAGGLESLAGGDLTAHLDAGFAEAFARIRSDFNLTIGRLRETVGTVAQSAAAIETGAREISSASDSLAARAEQQAASLEETVAALSEITANIKRAAEGARKASEAVATADAEATSGAAIVRQTVAAIDGIADSSRHIEQIVGVIDEIAFQTNLLALNAGVEAARAGEAGRGFAVVASEVRGLALRSADAAKEIKALIAASAAQVDQGVKLAARSGAALDRIIVQVSGINRAVAEIAAGAQQQANGLSQIDEAVREMDLATQQNASMAEQSTAASHSLAQETTKLSDLVERFKLDGGRQAQRTAA